MKRFVTVAMLATLAFASIGQSNDFVDQLLGSKAVTYGQVAYLILVSSGNIGEDVDTERAFEFLRALDWTPPNAAFDRPIRLDQYALLLSRAFGLGGNLEQSIFPTAHGAYHSLSSIQVIQGKSDPGMPVSGIQAIQMIGRVSDLVGMSQ
ncbi:MAG: hypothetical protein M0001_14215 [Treponema sp.]|nr:hypothetical protein [Treponema sp.]